MNNAHGYTADYGLRASAEEKIKNKAEVTPIHDPRAWATLNVFLQ